MNLSKMKKASYFIYVIIAIGGILFFILNKSKTEKKAFREEYKNYVGTPGKITDKKQRLGPKAKVLITYSVEYTAQDGKEYKQTSSNVGNGLANSYEPGDTLTVYYNPLNPYDPIIDRSGMEMGSDIFNYNNVLPYVAGVLIVIVAIFIYSKKASAKIK